MTKSVDMKRKRKTSSGSGGVEQSCLNKSAFPEIDGHIMNLVKPKGGYIRKVTSRYSTYQSKTFLTLVAIDFDEIFCQQFFV